MLPRRRDGLLTASSKGSVSDHSAAPADIPVNVHDFVYKLKNPATLYDRYSLTSMEFCLPTIYRIDPSSSEFIEWIGTEGIHAKIS